MSLEIEAVYENGMLKLDGPLPLAESERVTVFVQKRESDIRQSAGLVPLPGDHQAVAYLLGPENSPFEHQ